MVCAGENSMSIIENHETFLHQAQRLNAALTEAQFKQILGYGEQLEIVNRSLNLTRIPASEYLTMHVLDSLMLAAVIDLTAANSLLDVGTGAGFPAAPLAIAFPHLEVNALDARNKKLKFISDTAAMLGIKNLTVQHARLEQLASHSRRTRYDVVCSRALANYETLLAWQLPFVAPGGSAILMKSTAQESEISSKPPAGWTQTIHRLVLPKITAETGIEKTEIEIKESKAAELGIERLLVVLKKN